MVLRLPDKWVWDSWFADTGTEYHLFYLQAPRSLGEESLRHHNATVGHAVSSDLREWRVLPDALIPGPAGAWDDLAMWTGSMLEHGGVWHLLYTGTQAYDIGGGVRQQIGLATSADLVEWDKAAANPVVELDPRWYEMAGFDAWRDPWVMPDPEGAGFHLLVTAKAAGSDRLGGVIGHAWSADLATWDVRPPLSTPGRFGHLEVPQAEMVEGVPVLVFSVSADRLPDDLEPVNTCFLAVGETLLGPWDLAGAQPIPVPELYAARLVRDRAGEWQVIGFRDGSANGVFTGEIIDPVPLRELRLI